MIPTITKQQVYDTAAYKAKAIAAAFTDIQDFKAWLDGITDSTLITSYGAVQGDLDILRSAVSDLDQLRTIWQGGANLASAKDFRTFSKQLFAYGSHF